MCPLQNFRPSPQDSKTRFSLFCYLMRFNVILLVVVFTLFESSNLSANAESTVLPSRGLRAAHTDYHDREDRGIGSWLKWDALKSWIKTHKPNQARTKSDTVTQTDAKTRSLRAQWRAPVEHLRVRLEVEKSMIETLVWRRLIAAAQPVVLGDLDTQASIQVPS
ncbi:unnamed protein product [Phytophthora fragariaefolia]|uniref:Unnamed protein product n=1 Tax=Phytophthora fragariaefolia TaxID=1490495 RepID=A0A9W6XS16_9STRA|nr:unnamed protein product [Phytophthora fragariaefolia]